MVFSYNFYDLSRVPLSHTLLSAIATDAWDRAQNPKAKINQCPWDKARSTTSKYKRLVWRSIFRRTQEARLALVAEVNLMAGRKIAA